jgi:cystathionine beta-lyase/cystathionine gamma-synthase
MKFATKAIHAGVQPDPSTGAIMTPIYQTSTYVQEAPGKHKGYEYARTQNPTRDALQTALASLENAQFGLCFGSGLAATDAVVKLFNLNLSLFPYTKKVLWKRPSVHKPNLFGLKLLLILP